MGWVEQWRFWKPCPCVGAFLAGMALGSPLQVTSAGHSVWFWTPSWMCPSETIWLKSSQSYEGSQLPLTYVLLPPVALSNCEHCKALLCSSLPSLPTRCCWSGACQAAQHRVWQIKPVFICMNLASSVPWQLESFRIFASFMHCWCIN